MLRYSIEGAVRIYVQDRLYKESIRMRTHSEYYKKTKYRRFLPQS